ncbi:hypothetical protein F5B19DRAFT_443613 [Rostrohypoxylon terebratum]|nr:hypothetical protein F5B19DRAFT_443613 [Rostrohypoxylon terebratum]
MLADLQLQIEPSKLADVESKVKKILTCLGFTGSRMAQPISSLSGGLCLGCCVCVPQGEGSPRGCELDGWDRGYCGCVWVEWDWDVDVGYTVG